MFTASSGLSSGVYWDFVRGQPSAPDAASVHQHKQRGLYDDDRLQFHFISAKTDVIESRAQMSRSDEDAINLLTTLAPLLTCNLTEKRINGNSMAT